VTQLSSMQGAARSNSKSGKDLEVVPRYTFPVSAFKDVGRALAKLRDERGISQALVADRMGTTHKSNVSSIENGGNQKADSIDRYLDAIGATAHDLARALDEISGRTPPADEIAEPASHYGSAEDLLGLYPEAPQAALKDLISAAKDWQAADDALQVARLRLAPYKRS